MSPQLPDKFGKWPKFYEKRCKNRYFCSGKCKCEPT